MPRGSSCGEPQARKGGSVRVLAFASFGSVVQSCGPARIGSDANVSRRDLGVVTLIVMMCLETCHFGVSWSIVLLEVLCCSCVAGAYRGRPVEDGGPLKFFDLPPPLPDRNFGQGWYLSALG